MDELLMLMEGALELEMQGKTIRPAIGEEVFIPAHTNHSVRNIGSTTEDGCTSPTRICNTRHPVLH
jgi:quercetin dioxygenase-like cupin family protein